MQLSQLHNAINRCVSLRLPFAVYAEPGSDDYTFLCCEPDEAGENELPERLEDTKGPFLRITLFNNENDYCMGVHQGYTAEEVERLDPLSTPRERPDVHLMRRSTPKMLYTAQVHTIKSQLSKRYFPKAVLSKVIAGTSARTDVGSIAEEYFAKHPQTFRSIYFTQETGLWIGATPEILLQSDGKGHFRTVALAGTRPISDEPWDEKNIYEHSVVSSFIKTYINYMPPIEGIHTVTKDVTFGELQHRCEEISWESDEDYYLIHHDALNPTPAVAGQPNHRAIELIQELETHNRGSYGGTLTVPNAEGGHTSYVNLRCALLQPTDDGHLAYNIYVGGGIVPGSVPEREWQETEAKAASLLAVLEPELPY